MSTEPTKKLPNALIMDNMSFLMCASRLRRETGDDLEQVGMSAEFQGISITISGEDHEGHKVKLVEFCKLFDGEWLEMEPTLSQKAALQAVLAAEVEKVIDIQREGERIDAAYFLAQVDENKYGRPDTLYGPNY